MRGNVHYSVSVIYYLLWLVLWWPFLAHSDNLSCPQNPEGKTISKTLYLQQNIGIIQHDIRKMRSKTMLRNAHKCSRDQLSHFHKPSPLQAFRNVFLNSISPPNLYICQKKTCKNLTTIFLRVQRLLALVETKGSLLTGKHDISLICPWIQFIFEYILEF